MSRWFRFYDDAINDPKVLRLSDELYRAWTILLCLTSKNGGNLPPADDIALALRMKPSKVCEWLTKLHAAALLDKTETGFQPHNWNGRQYKSDVSTERVKRFRNTRRNVSETPDETAPEQKQITDTEQKDNWPSDFREQFWNGYPHKIGRADAIAKLEGVRERGISWISLMDGLRRYIAHKPHDCPWCNPANWLDRDRWEDQPAGSVVEVVDNSTIDWDDQIARFKRGLHWSCKWFGPEPGMDGCRVPVDILARHGYLNDPQDAPPIHINSMQ